MATGQEIIDRARRGIVDVSNYPDAVAEEDMNIYYHKVEDVINTRISEKFFWDIFVADSLVAGQNEYQIPTTGTANFSGVTKTLGVSLKFVSTQTSFKKAEPIYPESLEHDLTWYELHQSTSDPRYMIADSSYFVYPTPLVDVANGIRLYGIKGLIDISKTTTSANMFGGKIPSRYHHIVSEGMKEAIYLGRGQKADARDAKASFDEKLDELVEFLGERQGGIIVRDPLPDLSRYR